MDNFKEAYDELVHKHLTLKEQYEEIEDNKYTGGDLATIGQIGASGDANLLTLTSGLLTIASISALCCIIASL